MISLVFVFLIQFFPSFPTADILNPGITRIEKGAVSRNKFIVFSGSDWCKGCIQFRKKVLDDPSFESFARQNLDIVVADFPQRAKLDKALVEQNEALAEKYNPKGIFPNLVLLSDDGSQYEIITYTNQSPQEFVTEIKNRLQHLNG